MVAISGSECVIGLAIAALVIGMPVLRQFRRADTAKQRATVFPPMGFVESTREQVFGDGIRAFTESVYGTRFCNISPWVGKGSSALGETLIFELTPIAGDTASKAAYTVIGFRVGGPVTYFDISHLGSIERLVMKATGTGAGTTPTGEPLFNVPLVSAGKPHPANDWRILSSDSEQMQHALTPAFADALGRIDGRNLNIRKLGTDWLFFYRYAIHPLSPQDYPGLLKESVDLLSLLDLHAQAASH